MSRGQQNHWERASERFGSQGLPLGLGRGHRQILQEQQGLSLARQGAQMDHGVFPWIQGFQAQAHGFQGPGQSLQRGCLGSGAEQAQALGQGRARRS